MGSILGPMLQKELKKRWGIQAKRWGKASSGLARPDFHDWPSKVPNLMRRHRPDYVVVSLGTNDHQALKTQKGWIKTSNDRWAKSYKQRVLIMLRRLSGRDRRRAIVWLGPTNFNSNNARKLGPKINRLIKEAINEFDGPAVFVDARRATSNKNGEPGVTYRHPKKGKQPMRTSDGIHLTTDAVRTLLAAPVYKAFADCWDSDVAARDAIRQQRKEERLAKRKAKREAAKAKREAEKAEKQKTASKHATGDTPATSTPSAAPAAKAPKAEAKPTASAPTEGGAPQVVAPAPDKDVEPKGPKAGNAKDQEKQAGPKKDAALPDKPSDTPKGSPGADESPEGKKPSQESAKPSGASGDATTPSTGSQAKPKPKDDPDSKKETKGASKAAKEGDKGSEKAAPKPVASPSEGKAEAKTKKATCRSKKSTSDKSAPKSKPDKGAEPAEKKAE